MHTGVHCIASERSWQKALVSLVSSFFSSSWLSKKSQGPCWVGDRCAGAAVLRFLPALQSHPGRGIMKSPALPRSPGQPQISHLSLCLYFSLTLSLSLPRVGIFLTTFSCFSPHPFISTFTGSTQPFSSGQAAFLCCFSKRERWAEWQKGQPHQYSESWSAFFEYEESHQVCSQWDSVNAQVTIKTEGSVGFDACHIE